ncbi:MAG: COX15/CtaA family protein [Rhodocyclales bacterium]|nr:COX15/CtaA family protein [Rhodocyclales bacterium]
MEEPGRRLRRIRYLALALTALSLLVILVSAYIRLNGAGLGCSPWPECYGQILSGGPHPHSGGVRILHRVVASLALVLGFVLVWQCLRPTLLEAPKCPATALLGLMILLTFVGIFSADPHRVWAGFINILGGALLLLLSWRSVLATLGPAPLPDPRRHAPVLHAGLGMLALTLIFGALIGARYAAPACPSLPGCGDVLWPGSGWSALNPLATIAVPTMLGDAGGAALHLLHRWSAVATLLLLGLGALRALALPFARLAAGVVLVALLLQISLGVLTVLGGFGLGMAVAHSVCAAVLFAAGMHLLRRVKVGAA